MCQDEYDAFGAPACPLIGMRKEKRGGEEVEI
jgi:hypothetical protein